MSPSSSNSSSKKTSKKDLESQVSQLTAALQRERADAENVRRRAAINRDQDRQLVVEQTVMRLLPIIDNLRLAFAQPPDDLADNQWVSGVLRIDHQLTKMLADLGLETIPTVGQIFDPNLMEAIEIVATADQPEQTVVTEIASGYLLADKVLRVAKVKVAVALKTKTK